jgi:hypothetical protein
VASDIIEGNSVQKTDDAFSRFPLENKKRERWLAGKTEYDGMDNSC